MPRPPTLYISRVTRQIDSADLPTSPVEYWNLKPRQHVNIFCFVHVVLKLEFLVKLEKQQIVLTLWVRVCTPPCKRLASQSRALRIYFCCPG